MAGKRLVGGEGRRSPLTAVKSATNPYMKRRADGTMGLFVGDGFEDVAPPRPPRRDHCRHHPGYRRCPQG